ncbi:MAG TPA: endolytic transglycosylase MltG [Candidatus Humimicrobiaceae bacterium]|nr:endolytic transglycosylase MltG [Candidatus Humimicrobiaceae bacterium]
MKKINFAIIFIIFIIILGLFIAWQFIYLPKSLSSEEELTFTVKEGEGSKDISVNLEKTGLIKWGPAFRIYVLREEVAGKLQAGNYHLSPSMNIPEIVNKFVNGDVIQEKITFPEGFNLRKIKKSFENSEFLKTIDLGKFKIINFKGEFDFLSGAPDEVSLEGFLFPDTYFFEPDMKEREVAEIFLSNFDKKIAPYQNEISAADLTLFDVITMASLIEKEVQTKEDKELVSGIFWKRIGLGKPLESCATIAYIKGVDQWLYSFEDTRIESPYNTYLNPGLPLGPICNPGLESILAALYPKDSDYWYYLSTPEGETIFSKTFEEHSIAKGKYLK